MDLDRKARLFHSAVDRFQGRVVDLQIRVPRKQHRTDESEFPDVDDLPDRRLRRVPRQQPDAVKPSAAAGRDLRGRLVQLYAQLRRLLRREEARIRDVRTDDGDIHLPRVHRSQDGRRIITLVRQSQDLGSEVADQDAALLHAFRIGVVQHVLLQHLREDMALNVDPHSVPLLCLFPYYTTTLPVPGTDFSVRTLRPLRPRYDKCLQFPLRIAFERLPSYNAGRNPVFPFITAKDRVI